MSDLFGNHIVGFSTRWLIYTALRDMNVHKGYGLRFETEQHINAHLHHPIDSLYDRKRER